MTEEKVTENQVYILLKEQLEGVRNLIKELDIKVQKDHDELIMLKSRITTYISVAAGGVALLQFAVLAYLFLSKH